MVYITVSLFFLRPFFTFLFFWQAFLENVAKSEFMYLLENIEWPFSDEDWTCWESNLSLTPTSLEWDVNLAIKTWQYR